jgi:N-methylhydantoinase A
MLLSDIRKEYSRTVMRPLQAGLEGFEELLTGLETRARADLEAEGIGAGETVLTRLLDVRYRGQSYDLSLPAPPLVPGAESAVSQAFDTAHRLRFGYASAGAPCEVVNVRLQAVGRVRGPSLPYDEPAGHPPPQPVGRQPVCAGTWLECAVFNREALLPGQGISGPALLLQPDTTTWLPPAWVARVDGWYNLIVTQPGIMEASV